MSMTMARLAPLLLLFAAGLAAPNDAPDLKALYDGHRWFELRDGVDERSSPFYRGAVACAFNDATACEKTLRAVIRSSPRSEDAADARGMLLSLYHRAGRFNDALREIDTLLAAEPGNDSLRNARGIFGAFGQHPDQFVVRRRQSTVRYRMKGGNLFVPVSIGKNAAHYLVDTGANFSLMSESEARRLGLAIHEGGARVTDITGGTLGARTAVIDELQVGETRLRHVAFLVVGDGQQPFVDLAPDERGVLGLPVLLAFDAFRWTSDGTFVLAVPATRQAPRNGNVAFDGAMPVTEGRFGGRPITLHLDTGAVRTMLWPRFAEEFATVLKESGVAGTTRVTGVGRSLDVDAITAPELTLRIGGLDTVLRPARVLVQQSASAAQRDHGNLGLDLLAQGRTATLDFRSMTLALK